MAGGVGEWSQVDIPAPYGYSPAGEKFSGADVNTYTSTTLSGPFDTPGPALQVTKRIQGCRYRQHPSRFHVIEIVQPMEDEASEFSSENPAIWETEPKEDVGMDIYYEASPALPIEIDAKTNEMFAPYGSIVVDANGNHNSAEFPDQNIVSGWTGNRVWFTSNIDVGDTTGSRIGFMRPDGLVTYAIVNERTNVFDAGGIFVPAGFDELGNVDPTNLGASSNYFTVRYLGSYCPHPTNNWWSDGPHNQPVDLGWYNAFAYGNGIESDRIRDDYNQITIANGVKASSVVATQYEEERRKTGLIHSGLYNSTSGINNLNQFLTAEKITKDMNPEYGSIQKLHTRDGDILVMHEDKIMKVMADKNALFNADGKSNVALSSNFLGSDKPFATKYGISTNPESFAADSSGRVYFTDRARSAVLRLSGDGITNISDYGMKDWFNDHLNSHTGIAIGSYDAKKRLYNISIEGWTPPLISDDAIEESGDAIVEGGGCGCANVSANEEPQFGDVNIMSGEVAPNLEGYDYFQKTLSFSEQAKGWVSFKSFFAEIGLSLNNEYYTWDEGDMYQHHTNSIRNNFYGVQYKSTIDILFNDSPEIVKSFTALNYEGSLARITPHVLPSGISDGEYYNLTSKDGWYVDQSTTDLQTTGQLEFKNKEGKYFSYIKGTTTTLGNLDEQEFSVQGIGILGDTSDPPIVGPPPPPPPGEELDFCLEIEPLASCPPPIPIQGCTDPLATNYDAYAFLQCNGDTLLQPNGPGWDSCCTYPVVYGCMDNSAINYDPNATNACDDNNPADGVIVSVNGVMTPGCICNQTGDDCCCCYVSGCMDPTAVNYDAYACCDRANDCIYPCSMEGSIQSTIDPTGIGTNDGGFELHFFENGVAPINGWTITVFDNLNNDIYSECVQPAPNGLNNCPCFNLYPPNTPTYNPFPSWQFSAWQMCLGGGAYYVTITNNDTGCTFDETVGLIEPSNQFTCFNGFSTNIEIHNASINPGPYNTTPEDWATTYSLAGANFGIPGDEGSFMSSTYSLGFTGTNLSQQGWFVWGIDNTFHYTNAGWTFVLDVSISVNWPTAWLEALNGTGGNNLPTNSIVFVPFTTCFDDDNNLVDYSTIQNVNGINQNWESENYGTWQLMITWLNSLQDINSNPIFSPAFTVLDDWRVVGAEIVRLLGIEEEIGCAGTDHQPLRPNNFKC